MTISEQWVNILPAKATDAVSQDFSSCSRFTSEEEFDDSTCELNVEF